MIETRWFKWILYIVYTIGCAFTGCVIFYGAKNGMLHTAAFDHLAVKAMIIGIPAVLCIIFDMIYHPCDMIEAFAWETALFLPFVFLLIGYLIVGGEQSVSIFELSLSPAAVYTLMYSISLVIIYLTGILSIWIAEDERPKNSPSRSHTETHTPPTPQPQCGPGGWPVEHGPNYIPRFWKNSE